ncbi:3-oxoacyl-[acyl-carrier-protein] synthase II [Singulisphaera sp. GP187]|uniref:beta-ketoacyl-[acyl-carrier-protein] synthase family protein n=1 Tax=Singulisphaera sp. GP187 TaxID=1882752 RepID=UPI00092C6D22|nr:beta-ketoacyl-[acyl-carrier-protein] synthase family protein [Singulisphaera sp. GP187]SIO62285.1 3-oxoacyl-[acyl-carrier-protein] synthase II [Singulisphaera sp. GP187]
MSERIVVVGHSAITCLGRDLATTWDGLVSGRSGLARHTVLNPESFLQDVGGLVEDFGPGSSTEDPAVAKLGARFLHLSLAAARAAWTDAGLDGDRVDPERVAVVVGSALGGQDLLDTEQARMAKRRSLAISPFVIPGLIINQAAGQVAQHLGLYGPSVAPANACASGGHAIALGAMFLRAGEADFALCGAGESTFTPPIVNGFATMKALLPRRADDRSATDPGQSSRPFSADRAGFVLAEGAGMVALATESAANRLGLTIQAEYVGHALNTDGFHVSLPSKEKIIHCLTTALRRADVRPDEIDYYNAHGTSTIMNDRIETEVVKAVFGDGSRKLPVSSIKGAIGHSLGAASAIEAAICVRALLEQLIPPTINHIPDPELDLDYVPGEARAARLETVMTASFGFGGTNNALIFRRWNR